MENASKLDSQWHGLVSQVSEVIDLDATAHEARALLRRRRSAAARCCCGSPWPTVRVAVLRSAAAWAAASGLAELSDTAMMNRIRGAADWLGEVAGALLRRGQAAPPVAAILPDRRLRIIVGSVITRPGSRGTDWRLHAT